MLLGGALAVFAAVSLRKSHTNVSWGPGAYAFSILEAFVVWALILVPIGALLVLIGARKLRSRRGA